MRFTFFIFLFTLSSCHFNFPHYHLKEPERLRASYQRPLYSLQILPPKIGKDQRDFKNWFDGTHYFVWWVLGFSWGTKGNESKDYLRGESIWLIDGLEKEVSQSLTQTFLHSGLFRKVGKEPADFTLETEIVYLHTSHYSEFDNTISGTYMGFSEKVFLPYSLASMVVKLIDNRNGENRVLFDAIISENYLPDGHDYEKVKKSSIENDHYTNLALLTYKKLLKKIPDLVAPALLRADKQAVAESKPLGTGDFYIARLLPDRKFIERACISIRTNEVLSSHVEVREEPIFSAPNEWVLDPYQGGTQILSEAQYEKLAAELSPIYGFKRIGDRYLVGINY